MTDLQFIKNENMQRTLRVSSTIFLRLTLNLWKQGLLFQITLKLGYNYFSFYPHSVILDFWHDMVAAFGRSRGSRL